MRQLVVDYIPDDFSPATHSALGAWCFFGRENIYPDWDQLSFADAFSNIAELNEGGRISQIVAHTMLDRIWPKMNKRHGTHYSRAFWRILLLDWLIYTTMLTWRLWRNVELFVRQAAPEPLEVPLVMAVGKFEFGSTQDYVNACTFHSDFRCWLTSEIVRRLAPPNWHLRQGRAVQPGSVSPLSPIRRRRRSIERIAESTWRNVRWARLWQFAAAIYLDRLPKRPARADPPVPELPHGFAPNFLKFLSEIAALTMPKSMTAGFGAMDAEAKRQRYSPGRLYITTINPHDDQGNFYLAHATEKSERVVAVQHGGVYGWASADWLHATIEYPHDTFLTWGWRKYGDYKGRFVPMPSPMLSSGLNMPRRPDDRIMLVGAFMYGMPPRFDTYPPLMDYRRWKARFIERLEPRDFARLRYRPYPSVHTFSDGAWLRRRFPTLPIVEGNLTEVLFETGLVVLDHPSTTLCITLATNIPTIAFWDKNAWPLAREAQPLFDDLMRVGILFTSPEEAATRVTAIADNIEDWWQSPARQNARINWSQHFALADRRWWAKWWRAFPSL